MLRVDRSNIAHLASDLFISAALIVPSPLLQCERVQSIKSIKECAAGLALDGALLCADN